jgi:hypothetical protein
VLLALLLGFEAASLQRWTLSRRNWRQLDIVVADDEEAAERRFFDRWTAKQRAVLATINRRSIAAGRRRRGIFRSSACSRSREPRGERRHHRLRLRQSALRRESVRARRARAWAPRKADRGDPRSGRGARADRIVLPGVGAFADCRKRLDALDGMIEALTEAVRKKARPFFGICVGMQLMATRGRNINHRRLQLDRRRRRKDRAARSRI